MDTYQGLFVIKLTIITLYLTALTKSFTNYPQKTSLFFLRVNK